MKAALYAGPARSETELSIHLNDMSERKISGSSRRFLPSSHNATSPKCEVNLALVGPLHGGKSALAVRYMTQRFIGDYDPALEDTYTKVDWIEGQSVLVRIMDTSDQNSEDDLLAERYLRWADCVLMVFSITSQSSFRGIRQYLDVWRGFHSHRRCRRASHDATTEVGGSLEPSLKRSATPTLGTLSSTLIPTAILVATKNELESAREVFRPEMEEVAKKFKIPLFETSSAEDWESVEQVFHAAIREGLLSQQDKGARWRHGKHNEHDKFASSLLQALSVGNNNSERGSTFSGHPFRTRSPASSERSSTSSGSQGASGGQPPFQSNHQQQYLAGSLSPGNTQAYHKDFLTPFRKDSKDRFSRFKTLKGIFQ